MVYFVFVIRFTFILIFNRVLVDPDQSVSSVASDLDRQYSPMSQRSDARLIIYTILR